MLQGTITFKTRIKSKGVRFPLVEFNSNKPGVGKVEIEAPNGFEIVATVHLASVASRDEARKLAAEVHVTALDRIVFKHGVGIENPECTGEQYSPPVEVYAVANVGTRVGLVTGIEPTQLKAELEQVSLPGEHNYSLFRSARQSQSPTEEFMHLHNILLMIFNDKQRDVEAFIMSEDPATPQTQHPLKPPGVMETVYTKLRNELGHKRAGVNVDKTKSQMAERLDGLIALTKRAIELHP